MELIEIIKQSIFLIILLGIGIFSLSFSIYKIRMRNKFETMLQPVLSSKIKPAILPELQVATIDNNQRDSRKRTSERFIVINELSAENAGMIRKQNTRLYQLKSIRNTGMYTLKFE